MDISRRSSRDEQRGRYSSRSPSSWRTVWFRLWKLMHSDTRLRSRTRSFVHLLRLAQQLMAKDACGATKTCRDDLVRPSRPGVYRAS